MQKDFNKPMRALDGTKLEVPVMKKGKIELDKDGNPKTNPLTFKNRILDSLIAYGDKDRNLSGEQKIELFDLAMRIQKAKGKMTISVTEAKLIKERCAVHQPQLIYGQINELIECK